MQGKGPQKWEWGAARSFSHNMEERAGEGFAFNGGRLSRCSACCENGEQWAADRGGWARGRGLLR
eukprot:6698830-Karenia_brevis.AAC.1